MNLSTRLSKIVKMSDECNTIIDVGTDHGYVPIELIKNNTCKKALASDINKGPLEKAEKNIKLEGLNDKIECRLGAGLSVINKADADAAIIAGMGGNLIRDIIENDMDIFKEMNYCILQPVQNVDVLRKYIYDKGYKIIEEDLCKDDGKYYEIMKIKYDNVPKNLEGIYYEISPILIENKHPLLKEYITFKINKYEKIYSHLNEDTENSRNRKTELNYTIKKLKEMITWL